MSHSILPTYQFAGLAWKHTIRHHIDRSLAYGCCIKPSVFVGCFLSSLFYIRLIILSLQTKTPSPTLYMLALSRYLQVHHWYRVAGYAETPQYDILAVLLLNVENFQNQQYKIDVCFEAGIRTRQQTAVSSRGFIQHCHWKQTFLSYGNRSRKKRI